ncbi:hypothetical protein [uncultured Helicobacter sp.]|uniref:hypothetical protein n=1 Tax=uncultured Helicobacter sp. TaxID=175537 RepID=UPI00260E217A|nr:hypothetical protein [uncultured Helicobacter sp.]
MKHHIKTLTIITDSLSLSRDCTPIESTWVDRFMQTMGGGGLKYTSFPKGADILKTSYFKNKTF